MDTRRVLLGLDDTDAPAEGGTGRLARELGELLVRELGAALLGVSRHRLLQDPRVPCTRKNQASCIGLGVERRTRDAVTVGARAVIARRAVAGSDPGMCVASLDQITPAILAFGSRVKETLVQRDDALELAAQAGIHLEALGGTGDGVIGALAAVGLRASGNDGRFTLLGTIREVSGVVPVSRLLGAGIVRVCETAGTTLPPEALVDTRSRVRPWLRGGEAVLVVEWARAGVWQPVRARS